jgi:hypothetical protein
MNFLLLHSLPDGMVINFDGTAWNFRGKNGRKGRSVKHLIVFSSHPTQPLSTSEIAPNSKQFTRQNEPCKWG